MSLKYRFHIPNYVPNSNGIAILWEAAYQFSLSRQVSISTFHHGELRQYEIPNKYKKLLSNKIIDKDSTVVIYPDAMHGNPLNATMVSRYMLAKEYIFDGKKIEYEDGDYLFCYSNAVSSLLDRYNIVLENLALIKDYCRPKVKGKIAIYYGKCRIAMQVKNFSSLLNKFTNISIITRTNPSDKKDLYREIAESEVFISFDSLSGLCHEATLLGTPVIIMDDVFREAYDNFDHKLHGFYYSNDITEIDAIIENSVKLLGDANQELDFHLKSIPKRTSKIIDKIEVHFASINKVVESRKRNNAYHLEGLNFYIEKWGCSPILNCFSMKSVCGFHILNAKPKVYFILRFFHLIWINFKFNIIEIKFKFKRSIFYLWNNNKYIYLDNEFKNVKYKINPKKMINQYSANVDLPLPVIKGGSFGFKLLAKLLCI